MQGYERFYNEVDRARVYSSHRDPESHHIFSKLKTIIEKYYLSDKKVLEIGSGNGRFQDIVADYVGIDVSETLKGFYHKHYLVVRNGQNYPFENETFDFVFTYAVFEHIPDINHALKEMIRVTKKEGIIFFNPAWNCRPWAAKGHLVRPYSDFDFWEKLYKVTIPIRESILFRILHIIPKRFFYTIRFFINKTKFQEKVNYRKLKPNYKVFWQSDSDACNSIDPYSAILYFKANDLKILNYPSLLRQLLVKTDELILQKL
jgi:SAM-dependent methyltransferase